jgi:hypothetical protein
MVEIRARERRDARDFDLCIIGSSKGRRQNE